jgi:hypothetical protein
MNANVMLLCEKAGGIRIKECSNGGSYRHSNSVGVGIFLTPRTGTPSLTHEANWCPFWEH